MLYSRVFMLEIPLDSAPHAWLRRTALPVLVSLAAATAAAALPGAAPGRTERTVELHVGIPGLVVLGDPQRQVLERLPGAEVTPFAGQEDAATVKAPAAGLSLMTVGPPAEGLKVASLGINLVGRYEGVGEAGVRTSRGIGKGSTVNDLLEAYGPPAGISADREAARRLRGRSEEESARIPRHYQYRREDGAVTTSFVVQDNMVVRILINEIEPLRRHILKVSPPEPPAPPAPAPPADPTPPIEG
jgi:hypothetical protein